MFDDFVFGKDVFLETKYPLALDSKDDWSPEEYEHVFGRFPLSIVADFWDGSDMARDLLKMFPGKDKLLDLGTATGSVPLSMRKVGMKALGLEGQPCKDLVIPVRFFKDPDLYAWTVSPEIVDTCDVTYPFKIVDNARDVVKFDYIISTDCFEHLREERLLTLLDNIYNHLKDDGYGIFDIALFAFHKMHQTVKERQWWKTLLEQKFLICEDLMSMDFHYVRASVKNGMYCPRYACHGDPLKALFWVKR